MRNLFSALCVSVLLLSLFLSAPVEGQEVKTIGLKEFNALLAASKGKVVVLDFWATF
uniref:hypothetical protein n=1 Tax=Candidatus Tripitaka californicus TaxID=3367616 RepID=UPI004027E037